VLRYQQNTSNSFVSLINVLVNTETFLCLEVLMGMEELNLQNDQAFFSGALSKILNAKARFFPKPNC